MTKKLSVIIVFSFFLFVLSINFLQHKALAADSNITSNTTTTFTIIGGSNNDKYDANGKQLLSSYKQQGVNAITLDSSMNNRTAELPIGSVIFLHFPIGTHTLSITPSKGVVEKPSGRFHLPSGDIGIYKVVGKGTATIVITEHRSGGKQTTSNTPYYLNNWSGYLHTGSSGTYNDVTAKWVVPTASGCSGSFTDTSDWVGIDGYGNSNLIQTGTESECQSGSSTAKYQAWWEILPASETVLSCTITPGDSMFAEVKKNSTNWTITLKDLSTGVDCSSANQSYSGQQATIEWIAEAPTTGGTVDTLTNYGNVPFTDVTQNGSNPSLSYASDSIDMTSDGTSTGTLESIPSSPNSNGNGFDTFYCTSGTCPTTYAPGGWTSEGNPANGDYDAPGVILSDGKVLVAGGIYNGSASNMTELYTDPGTWASKATMNAHREFFVLQPVTISGGGQRVLAAAGNCSCGSTVLSSAELYNESTNSWSTAASMTTARSEAASSILSDGTVLVTGGLNSSGTDLSSTELYDPVANTWTTKASLSTARDYAQQVTYTDSGGHSKVMVIGGENSSGRLSSTEIYDPSTNSWSAGPSLSYARVEFSAVLLHDGRILVVGGEGSGNTHSEVYDPSTNSWTTYITPYQQGFSPLNEAVVLGSGAGYDVLMGPASGTGIMLFNPSTNSWSVETSQPTQLTQPTVVGLSNGNVLESAANSSASEEYSP